MIAVIDYGLGNLRSVAKSFETLDVEVEVTNNLKKISKAKAIVLPGVGAFGRGIKNLKNLNLISPILKSIEEKKPFLGICLGLQLLFSQSDEHGLHKGLDIIKGKVKKFQRIKIPHMGWNEVKLKVSRQSGIPPNARENEELKIFKGIPDNSYFYFVHSYYVEPEDKEIIVATTTYGKVFASVINKDNIFGVQFHPEKSAEFGLKILENFLSLC